MNKPVLIGIAGGTGSGKTLVTETLIARLGSKQIAMIQLDSYYKELNGLSFEERKCQNFDHPDAIDERLLCSHIQDLIAGKFINRPVYDFTQHLRKKETVRLSGHNIIILEGIFVLYFDSIRRLLDFKVYTDTDADIRLIRRLKRDLLERDRSLESILFQYEKFVRPMHLQFVESTKRYADIIIPEGGKNFVAIDLLQTKIESILSTR